jgi:hypothetical protein
MTSVLSNERMGYFMKDDLLDFVQAAVFNQVATDSNSSRSKITLTRSIYCAVKTK